MKGDAPAMSFFELNCRALLAHGQHADLVDRLREAPDLPDDAWQIFETDRGDFTLVYNNIPLHSPTGGVWEAKQLLKTTHVDRNAASAHVIIGMGLGYMLQALVPNTPGRVFVYEPNLPLLKFVLTEINLSEHLNSPRVMVLDDLFELKLACRRNPVFAERFDTLIGGLGYKLLMGEKLDEIFDEIREFLATQKLLINTYQSRHQTQVINLLHNLRHVHDWRRVDPLFKAFIHKPGLVVGRGPSLDDCIDTLKAIHDNDEAVIVAVGGAMRRLYEADITPHFAFIYDPMSSKEQFYGLPPEYIAKIHLIMSPFAPPETFELAPQSPKWMFLSSNVDYVPPFLNRLFNRPHVSFRGGGGVAVVSYDITRFLGCRPMALVGIDLAFRDNQVYAGGVEADMTDNILRLKTDETIYGGNFHMDETEGYDGAVLKTTPDFKEYAKELTMLASEEPEEIQRFNASLIGAKIEHFPPMPLAEFREKFCRPGAGLTPQDLAGTLSEDTQMLTDFNDALTQLTEVKDLLDEFSHLVNTHLGLLNDCLGLSDAALSSRLEEMVRSQSRLLTFMDRSYLMFAMVGSALTEYLRKKPASVVNLSEARTMFEGEREMLLRMQNLIDKNYLPTLVETLFTLKLNHQDATTSPQPAFDPFSQV